MGTSEGAEHGNQRGLEEEPK